MTDKQEGATPRSVVVGHTRFSVYSPDSGAWVASNGSKLTTEEYLEHLFSDERMEPRADIFFNYTLPMLELASKGHIFKHIVSYSDVLPDKYQAQMENAAARMPFLVLDKVAAGAGTANLHRVARQMTADAGLPATTPFGSMRLDDDDVLSADYFDQAAPYITEANVGSVVSLSRGVTALYEEGEFYYARDAVYPMHSKGHLSVCRFDETGTLRLPVSAPHNKSDRANPVILDSRKFSHLWVRSVSQDTSLYQLEQGRFGQIKRIYEDMDSYPELTSNIDDVFPLLADKIHSASRLAAG